MKLPSSQLRAGRKSGSLVMSSVLPMAPVRAEIATPARIKVIRGVPCAVRATAYATATAVIPPAKAATGTRLTAPSSGGTPTSITMVAANPAPDATPTR